MTQTSEISIFQQDLSNFIGKISRFCELVHIFSAVYIPKPAFLDLYLIERLSLPAIAQLFELWGGHAGDFLKLPAQVR